MGTSPGQDGGVAPPLVSPPPHYRRANYPGYRGGPEGPGVRPEVLHLQAARGPATAQEDGGAPEGAPHGGAGRPQGHRVPRLPGGAPDPPGPLPPSQQEI